MMLKQILFAVAPMLLLSGSAFADDALLSSIAKLESPTSVQTPSDPADAYGKADVDALLGDDTLLGEEAVAACFRRIGYYRHNSFRRCYYGYRSWRRPCYRTYYSYPSIQCYRPVYHRYYAPIYSSYWGCW